jgi:hypothetical protein
MKLTTILEDCWKGYTQYGMKEKDGKQVPNCVPANEEIMNEGRGVKSIQKDLDKVLDNIQSALTQYKAHKGTDNEKKHVENLKKLHSLKIKLEAELDGAVSGLYRDAELKIED